MDNYLSNISQSQTPKYPTGHFDLRYCPHTSNHGITVDE